MHNRTLAKWFALGHFANDWPIAALWMIVPAAGLSLKLTPAEIGLLFGLFTMGGALAYVPAGLLADHVQDRGRLLSGTFFWVALGYVFAALAPEFWSLAFLLAVAGMGNAAWHPIATGVLARSNRDGRAHALGVHAIGGSLAEVLAPLSAGLLLAFLDWRLVLAVSVLPTVLMGLCFLWVARAVPVLGEPRVDRSGLRDLLCAWRGRRGLRVVATISLYNMSLIALLSMIPLYLAEVHGLAPAAIGTVFAAILVSGALAQPWVGSLSDTHGRRPVLAIGTGLAALAITTLVFELPFGIMIPMMALGIAALDSTRAAVLAMAVDHSDRSESTTLGLVFALLDGVGAFGAVLAGMAASVSWPVMFGLAAALAFGAAVLNIFPADGSPGCGNRRSVTKPGLRLDRAGGKDRRNNVPAVTEGKRSGMTIHEARAEHVRRYWPF